MPRALAPSPTSSMGLCFRMELKTARRPRIPRWPQSSPQGRGLKRVHLSCRLRLNPIEIPSRTFFETLVGWEEPSRLAGRSPKVEARAWLFSLSKSRPGRLMYGLLLETFNSTRHTWSHSASIWFAALHSPQPSTALHSSPSFTPALLET